ncbi:hypothetical protein [Streptomyces sp. NBC_01766]|uniref:hypothetical protein n=1 Tax=Streptomyces sp. NBC_01766 TaxID=2975936 RepID=UPI002DDA6B4B|nr:hypothetical protein [Streptomyces sp. NBC_01766]WSC25100.1 hypothetical protein OIE60_35320 [Streptomyces sp. NBC_01766]
MAVLIIQTLEMIKIYQANDRVIPVPVDQPLGTALKNAAALGSGQRVDALGGEAPMQDHRMNGPAGERDRKCGEEQSALTGAGL